MESSVPTNFFLIILAALGGIAVSIQAQFMSTLDKHLGTLSATFFTYGSGAIIIALITLALRGGNFRLWGDVPPAAFLAGVLGLIIVATVSYTVPRLGLVPAFTVLVSAQFILSAIIDHFGLFGAAVMPINPTRMLGMGTVLFGTWLIIK